MDKMVEWGYAFSELKQMNEAGMLMRRYRIAEARRAGQAELRRRSRFFGG